MHEIHLEPGSKPYKERIPFLPPDKQKLVDAKIKELLERGMIEKGCSPWRSKIILIRKKDSPELQTVMDFKPLNKMTIANAYPVPLINKILQRMSKAKNFSKMDLTEGFWQVWIHPNSKKYTSFATRSGSYVWKRMTMGLKNSPAMFQRLMHEVFNDYSLFTHVYVDDIIIFSKTMEEHLEHIRKVLLRL